MRLGRGERNAIVRGRRRLGTLAVAGSVASGLGAVKAGVVQGAPALTALAPAKAAAAAAAPTVVREDVAQRTERSRTWLLSNGSRRTELSATPVHYRVGTAWQPVDSTLITRGTALGPKAGPVGISIPKAIETAPVKVAQGTESVAFQLRGAAARVTTSRSTARFIGARPGVEVRYEAKASSVKETLLLSSAAAGRTPFAFDLTPSTGMVPRLTSGGSVEITAGPGRRTFTIAAPWMRDARGVTSRGARYTLAKVATGRYRLTLALDQAWLQKAGRAFPVQVDPTTSVGRNVVCELRSGASANVEACSTNAAPVWVGRSGTTAYRALADFTSDTLGANVPREAIVRRATVTARYLDRMGDLPTRSVDVHELSRSFSGNASWSKATSAQAWTTPGGDVVAERDSRTALPATSKGATVSFPATRIVQGWLDGSVPQRGVMLKAADEALGHVDVLDDLRLVVDWNARTGR